MYDTEPSSKTCVEIIHGDCLDVLPTLQLASFDACVTDPPYELGFMGKRWVGTWTREPRTVFLPRQS